MSKLLTGVWDCKYCKNIAISGSLRECPNCGNPRGKNVKFYLPDQAKVVDEEEAKTINRNPDWLCSFCDSYNSDSIQVCESCGNPRGKADINYFQHHEDLKSSKEKSSTYEVCGYESSSYIQQDPEEQNAKVFSKLKNAISRGFDAVKSIITPKVLIIFSAVVLVILGIIALATPKIEKMTVEQIIWEYSMDIQEYRTVDESGWSLPSEARLHRKSQEIHHYNEVLDHYETKTRQVSEQVLVGYKDVVVGHKDLGNGYFEEITRQEPIYKTEYRTETYQEPVYKSVPVYQTKYYYEIDKWIYDRTVTSSAFDRNPYWPEVQLTDKERVSRKDSKYFVRVVDSENNYENISVEYDEWLEIEVDTVVTVKKWLWTSKIIFEE